MRKINKALLLGELEKKYSLNNNREIEYEEYQELNQFNRRLFNRNRKNVYS